MKRGQQRKEARRKPRTGRFEGASYPQSRFRIPFIGRVTRYLRRITRAALQRLRSLFRRD